MAGLPFPEIDPVAFSIGPVLIRWYGLAYLTGFLGGWAYAGWLADRDPDRRPSREDVDNLLPFLVFGVIAGGRLGYVLFYNFEAYAGRPLDVFKVWEGGMAFHGGLLGVAAAILLYAWRNKISALAVGDMIAAAAPIGLFFGRIANFINGELYGRIATVPWAVNFPRGQGLPRHPSQLYEAALEGLCLFAVLFFLARNPTARRTQGTLFGAFLAGYGVCRFIVEHFREPDAQIGYLLGYFSMGQMLSLPMVLAGFLVIRHARRSRKA